MEIEVYEAQNLSIVNPKLLPEIAPKIFATTDWDVLLTRLEISVQQPVQIGSLLEWIRHLLFISAGLVTPSAERRQIDQALFDALGLTAGEREAVYDGVSELVNNRKRRARNVV